MDTPNAGFDSRLLRQTAERHGLALPDLPWRCAMLDYAAHVGERWKSGSHKGQCRWQTLEVAATREGVEPAGAHRALADARMTLGVCGFALLGLFIAISTLLLSSSGS